MIDAELIYELTLQSATKIIFKTSAFIKTSSNNIFSNTGNIFIKYVYSRLYIICYAHYLLDFVTTVLFFIYFV